LGLDAGDDCVELTEEHLRVLFLYAHTLSDDVAAGRYAQIERCDWFGICNGLVDMPLLDFVDALQTWARLFI
jgi:hypothetical protein